jgi:hypothetical protein
MMNPDRIAYAQARANATRRAYIITSFPPDNGKVWLDCAWNRRVMTELNETVAYRATPEVQS